MLSLIDQQDYFLLQLVFQQESLSFLETVLVWSTTITEINTIIIRKLTFDRSSKDVLLTTEKQIYTIPGALNWKGLSIEM